MVSCDKEIKCCNPVVSAATLLFLVAMGLLAVYSFQIVILNKHDYQGPMRVTNVSFKLRVEKERCRPDKDDSEDDVNTSYQQQQQQKCTYITYYDAVLDVNWGYDWACSNFEKKVCNSEITLCSTRVCNAPTCMQFQEDNAYDRVYACTLKTYDPELTYNDFDPSVGPSNDVDWPSVVAYGDCDKCDSQLTVPSLALARGFKVAGGVVLLIAVTIASSLIVCQLVVCCQDRRYRYGGSNNTFDSTRGSSMPDASVVEEKDEEEKKAAKEPDALIYDGCSDCSTAGEVPFGNDNSTRNPSESDTTTLEESSRLDL